MATRTLDKKITMRGGDGGLSQAPAAAGAVLPHGTLAFRDSAGRATEVINAGANPLLGMMHVRCDNTGGAAGDLEAEFWKEHTFEMTLASASQADVGKKVYAADNQTLSLTSTSQTYVGTIRTYVGTDTVEVELDTQAP